MHVVDVMLHSYHRLTMDRYLQLSCVRGHELWLSLWQWVRRYGVTRGVTVLYMQPCYASISQQKE